MEDRGRVRTDGDIDDASLKQDPGLPTECGTTLGVGCDTAKSLGRVVQDKQFQTECGTAQLNGCNTSQLVTHNQNFVITNRISQTNNLFARASDKSRLAEVDMKVSREELEMNVLEHSACLQSKKNMADMTGKSVDHLIVNLMFQGAHGVGDGLEHEEQEPGLHEQGGEDDGGEVQDPVVGRDASGDRVHEDEEGQLGRELVDGVHHVQAGVEVQDGGDGQLQHVPDGRVKQVGRRRKSGSTVPINQPLLFDYLRHKSANFGFMGNSTENIQTIPGPGALKKRKSSQMEGPQTESKILRIRTELE